MEDLLDPVDADDSEQQLSLPRLAAYQALFGERGHVEAAPTEHPGERLADGFGTSNEYLVDEHAGEYGQNADHRADFDRNELAIAHLDPVVEESVVVVPQALVIERMPDEREVFHELQCQILCRLAVPSQN